MGNSEIREPMQKRSIEKKEKIIEAGFKLICEKGYHNTNTAEIAKEAGVSTGIVYNYFQDKHDILISGIRTYASSIFYPMFTFTNNKKLFDKNNINIVFKKMIDEFIKNHKLSKIAHEEIMAMIHSDKEVAEIFHNSELEITYQITEMLKNNGFENENLTERVHIAIGLIDNLCHEVVYHKHEGINYESMINIVVSTISSIFQN